MAEFVVGVDRLPLGVEAERVAEPMRGWLCRSVASNPRCLLRACQASSSVDTSTFKWYNQQISRCGKPLFLLSFGGLVSSPPLGTIPLIFGLPPDPAAVPACVSCTRQAAADMLFGIGIVNGSSATDPLATPAF